MTASGAEQAYTTGVDQARQRDSCAHQPAAPKPASTPFERYLSDCDIGLLSALPEPLDAYVKHLADQREQAQRSDKS